MHIFICLTSLFLTVHLSTPRASNFTLENVHESNFSQNDSHRSILETTTLDIRNTSSLKAKILESSSELFTSTEENTIKHPETVQHFVISTPQSQTSKTSTLSSSHSVNKFSQTSSPENTDVTRNTLSAVVTRDALSAETSKEVLPNFVTETVNTVRIPTKSTESETTAGEHEIKSVEIENIAKGGFFVYSTKSAEKTIEAENVTNKTNYKDESVETADVTNKANHKGEKEAVELMNEANTVDPQVGSYVKESVAISEAAPFDYETTEAVNFASTKTQSTEVEEATAKSVVVTPKAIRLEDRIRKSDEFEGAAIKFTQIPIMNVKERNTEITSTKETSNLEYGIQVTFDPETEHGTDLLKESDLSLISETEPVVLISEDDMTTQSSFSVNKVIQDINFDVNMQIPHNSNTPAADPDKDLSLYSDVVSATADDSSIIDETVTSFEETFEHNVILTTDIDTITDRSQNIVVGRKCTRIFQESILWNVTDGGMLALKSCPPGYQGNMYRPCFSNGKWGNVDYNECRLEHLGRMRHMIFHQVQKGMIGNMYVLADEFSKYISSVDMKSPMDRLEAFEILNTFLKLDMTLKMDKSRDMKYIQTLLYSCNELIKKKTVLFSPGSQKNKLITEKAVEMIFDLTSFAEKALRGLLKTQKKQIAFRSTSNVVLYLYRGKLSRQFQLMNLSNEFERDDELSSYFNLEKTLERSAYALIWVKGLHDLLSTENLLVDSDVAVATILSPLNSLNHMMHPPTFDIGLRLRKEIPHGYRLKCGQLWNMSHLWNTDDCIKATRKEDIVTCRCHHLGSISLLLEEIPQITSIGPSPPVGKLITVSCVTSLSATMLTLVINFLIRRRDQSLSIFILINLLVCLAAIQVTFMMGVNKTERFEVCLSFAVLLHYLFLVSCFWVVCYSIYLLRRLRSCMEYVGRIRDYCAISWIIPTILLIISFIGNPNEYETKQFCWLNVQKGILWSFVVPVTGLILVNTIVMIMALKIFQDQMSVTHKLEICKTRNSMRAGVTLLPYFAINWFFGILAVENSDNMILQVVFSFTNSMQGILTFVFFCVMDNNVQMLFRLKFHESSKKPKVSSMRLRKSGSFPILERPLMTLTDDSRRHDCTPLLCERSAYHDAPEDPCCSNIRV